MPVLQIANSFRQISLLHYFLCLQKHLWIQQSTCRRERIVHIKVTCYFFSSYIYNVTDCKCIQINVSHFMFSWHFLFLFSAKNMEVKVRNVFEKLRGILNDREKVYFCSKFLFFHVWIYFYLCVYVGFGCSCMDSDWSTIARVSSEGSVL